MEKSPEHRAEVKGPEGAVCLCSQGLPSPVSKSESLSPTAALRVGLEGPCGAPRKLANVWILSLRYFPVAMAKHHGQGRLYKKELILAYGSRDVRSVVSRKSGSSGRAWWLQRDAEMVAGC